VANLVPEDNQLIITGEKLLRLRNNLDPENFKKFLRENHDKLDINIINDYGRLYDQQVIDSEIVKERNNVELHAPGFNNLGPGTKVATRMRNGDKPINNLDRAALVHDIDYYNPAITREQADDNMVKKTSFLKPLFKTAFAVARAVKPVTEKNYDLYNILKSETISKGWASESEFTRPIPATD